MFDDDIYLLDENDCKFINTRFTPETISYEDNIEYERKKVIDTSWWNLDKKSKEYKQRYAKEYKKKTVYRSGDDNFPNQLFFSLKGIKEIKL